jgi:hypothetical protein
MNWKDEPKAIKAALKAKGYTVTSAHKGKGTASAWNYIRVKNCAYRDAMKIAFDVTGHDSNLIMGDN